jgi:ribosomal protein S18 acetylase RimI-like enzyme
MAGYDGRRGWINYVAVAPTHQRTGLGRAMMEAAEAYFRELDCLKVNLQVREANHAGMEFYRALGYTVDHVVSLGKRLADD